MKPAALRPELLLEPVATAGVLLPLPLTGAYDYKLPRGVNATRGLLVSAPLGPRGVLGVVWGEAEGAVGGNRLREAVPLEGAPSLPQKLCDFVDWVAQYTLSPPGMILAMVLRSGRAFEPQAPYFGNFRQRNDNFLRPTVLKPLGKGIEDGSGIVEARANDKRKAELFPVPGIIMPHLLCLSRGQMVQTGALLFVARSVRQLTRLGKATRKVRVS